MPTEPIDPNPSSPGEPPRIEFLQVDSITRVVFPRRKIDGVAVRMLYEHAASISADRAPRMIVDLSGVALISSGVMGILVTINKLFRHVNGQLHIVCPDPLVAQQFEVMNLNQILKLFTDGESALRFG